jgi:hypothetical protein
MDEIGLEYNLQADFCAKHTITVEGIYGIIRKTE